MDCPCVRYRKLNTEFKYYKILYHQVYLETKSVISQALKKIEMSPKVIKN